MKNPLSKDDIITYIDYELDDDKLAKLHADLENILSYLMDGRDAMLDKGLMCSHPPVPKHVELPKEKMYYVSLAGKTYGIKDELKAHGFRWDGPQKIWYKAQVGKSEKDSLKAIYERKFGVQFYADNDGEQR